jgi:molybdopterin molybdotransferase
VMVEYTARAGDSVTIERTVVAGTNFVPQGAEACRGAVLLPCGRRLDPASIAVAASVGKARLQVHALPSVAVLSTGDELVDLETQPGPSQIRNSNSYSLAAQVQAAGGAPQVLPIAPDNEEQLLRLLRRGCESDLLLVTGAVSMGKYDLVEQALQRLGAEFFFTGTLIQPGKPLVFGRAPRGDGHWTYFFGLPGNPVSTMVTFELFARPLLDALAGAPPRALVFVQARLKTEIRRERGLTRFLPALLSGEYERAEVELVRWQGSGDVVATAGANCYVVIPPDAEHIAAGEMVSLLLR